MSDWNRALHNDIPGLAGPTNEKIDKIWADRLAELQISVKRLLPALQPILKEEIPKLNAIKEQTKDRAKKALLAISNNASKVHPDYINTIHGKWAPTFQNALKNTGKYVCPTI